MRKIVDHSNQSIDCAVRDSLSTIRATHVRLHRLNGSTRATTALLASKIDLYDVLLDEISGIHTSLARDLQHTLLTSQEPGRTGLNG
jgi:hypothetical protein